MDATSMSALISGPAYRQRPYARIAFGRFGGPPFSGIHAVVIALLRHRVTGAIISLMGALGFLGWIMAYIR